MSRGEPLGTDEKVDVRAVTREHGVPERFAHLNVVLRVAKTGHPVTSVVIDGYEETSSISLVRPGARNIVFPGAATMLNPTRQAAIVGAVLRRRMPKFTAEQAADIADLIWSLSTMRNIYDSVESAADWGRSYVNGATITPPILENGKVVGATLWKVFKPLRALERAAADAPPPAAQLVPWHDNERLVIRTWFHQHVQRNLGHESLSEQRIASLMALAGWTPLQRSRSALTAHNPKDNSDTIQFRFYAVPKGWEEQLNGDDDDDQTP
jgi:hypothetical protein